MNSFSPGIEELSRIAGRWRNRWRLRGARRHLAKVETELGLLGWQQAEFDPDTQREVEKIQKFEREQARLTNESAAVSQEIAEIAKQREQTRAAFAQAREPLVAERAKLRESIDKARPQIAPLRRQLQDFEHRAAQLERDAREANRLYHDLLAIEPQTPELRDQQGRHRERASGIPGEIAETQTRRARGQVEMEKLQKALAQETAREIALGKELRDMESTHAAHDRGMAEAIAAKERAREKIEKENAALDQEKAGPYREIGRVLADSHLPPMNQPQALETVRASRLRIQEIEYEIAKAHADSDAADRTLVRHSLILCAAVVVAVVLVLGALIEW